MNTFNVILYDPNSKKFESYDVLPYFRTQYKKAKHKPKSFKEFQKFIKDQSLYMFWARCQYEIILVDWPCNEHREKWDVHQQIMMNLDIITNLLMNDIC